MRCAYSTVALARVKGSVARWRMPTTIQKTNPMTATGTRISKGHHVSTPAESPVGDGRPSAVYGGSVASSRDNRRYMDPPGEAMSDAAAF